jgi:hypothetical protein
MHSYPDSASLNRFLPKSKIFEFAKPTSKIKDLFVQQVDKITLAYSLSSRSINLPATSTVEEIQIFKIDLKNGDLTHDVLKCIDTAIHSPLIFELHYHGQFKSVATFKRPSESNPDKWIIGNYFESEWIDKNILRTSLPIALNLSSLYEKLLAPLMPYKIRDNENLQAHIERMNLIHSKERELEKIQSKLCKEKQFNKKIVINKQLRTIKDELEKMKDENG